MERKDEGNTDEFQKLVEGKAKYMVADLGGKDYYIFGSFRSKSSITFRNTVILKV